jgi:hypothetical protein
MRVWHECTRWISQGMGFGPASDQGPDFARCPRRPDSVALEHPTQYRKRKEIPLQGSARDSHMQLGHCLGVAPRRVEQSAVCHRVPWHTRCKWLNRTQASIRRIPSAPILDVGTSPRESISMLARPQRRFRTSSTSQLLVLSRHLKPPTRLSVARLVAFAHA